MSVRVIIMIVFVVGGVAFAWSGPRAEQESASIEALIAAAEPGATLRVPAGTYHGPLVVRKSVVLEGGDEATIDGGGEGTVVEIVAEGVVFRGFHVTGSGSDVTTESAAIRVSAGRAVIERNRVDDALFGIDLQGAPGSVVRQNTVRGKDVEPGRRGDGIRLWWSHDTIVDSNDVDGSRDMVFWYSEGLTIRENRVRNSRYGLHFMYSHDTTLSRNDLQRNSVGVYLMYSNRIRLVDNEMSNNRGASGYGIGLKDCDAITLEGNNLLSNRVGLYIDNSPSSVDSTGLIKSNMIAFNEIGLLATPNTHDNVITANAFLENEQQAATHGRGTLMNNTFSSEGIGNFWSDYAGFDRDGDGIGDFDHRPQSLFSAMMADVPNLRLFVHSPAQQAIEFTARALPELRPEPTLVDSAPLVRVPEIPRRAAVGGPSRSQMAWVGLGLFALGGGCTLAFGRSTRLPPAAGEKR